MVAAMMSVFTPLLLALLPAAAAEPGLCQIVRQKAITDVAPPAVIVLGERRGTQPDLARATRAVRGLVRQGDVTLAMQAVGKAHQPVLDRWTDEEISLTDLPGLVRLEAEWGFAFAPYRNLFLTARAGVKLVAIGQVPELRPPGQTVPMPPSYMHVLSEATDDHPLPVESEPDFVQTVTWMDHRLAAAAVASWDRQGYLVILADRFHVEGGKGISWQAQRLTPEPVHAFLLADGDASCYAADRVWR